MRRKYLLIAGLLLVVILGAMQLVPVRRKNPPVAAPLHAPAEVQAVLARACADCHSNETRWPWYAHLAPASWLLARHVRIGRGNLNLSYWELLSLAEQRKSAKAITDQLDSGAMPLRSYLWLHRDARLSAADRSLVRAWFASPAATPGPRADTLAGGGSNSYDSPDDEPLGN